MAKKAEKGDVIFVNRGAYKHYGVYAGKGRVVHYVKSPSDPLSGVVNETSLDLFCKGYPYYVDNNKKRLSPSLTVERARSMIGLGDYNLVTNNCEHVARGSQGSFYSSQVNAVATGLAAVSIAAVIGAGLGILGGILGGDKDNT